jgi:hypothetical protein
MTATVVHVLRCPVCQSSGEMIHHDVRASLVYSCRYCSHEWQINQADEPLEDDPAVAQPSRMPPAGARRPRRQ